MGELVVTIVSGVAIAVLCWLGAIVTARVRQKSHRRKVYVWLRSHTRDEPEESHVDTVTLAKGTRLTEECVRYACMSDDRIHRLPGEPEQWSIWRKEPQSIYEKRGPLVL